LNTSDQLTNKAIDQRTEFNDLNTKISDYIESQEYEEGISANMPDIEEIHKDILFTYWDVWIKKAKLAVTKATGVAKNIIKAVNHTFQTTKLIK